MSRLTLSLALLLVLAASAALAALTIPGDGSDGVFNPTANTVIDLSAAPTATWDTPGTGTGVYDPAKWAVVFKYQSVNVPAGVTVTFKNHASRAPVVWLVQGDVVIAGTVGLDGAAGAQRSSGGTASPDHTGVPTEGGPGGFPGGTQYSRDTFIGNVPPCAGLGISPAGGANPQLIPLIGGAGGAGAFWNYQIQYNFYTRWSDGGGGGGAILIATPAAVLLSGTISATGGNAYSNSYGGARGGDGGAIRLVCNVLSGAGTATVAAGTSGNAGRIRFETDDISGFTGNAIGAQRVVPQAAPTIWPTSTAPSVRIASIGGATVPADPKDTFAYFTADVEAVQDPAQPAALVVVVEATNVPATWKVDVRAVSRRDGKEYVVSATKASGTDASSTWTATLAMPAKNVASIIARAYAQ